MWYLSPSKTSYHYCGNNPIMRTDPDGNFPTKFGAWIHRLWHGGGGKIEKNSYGQYSYTKIMKGEVGIISVYGKGGYNGKGNKQQGGIPQWGDAREQLISLSSAEHPDNPVDMSTWNQASGSLNDFVAGLQSMWRWLFGSSKQSKSNSPVSMPEETVSELEEIATIPVPPIPPTPAQMHEYIITYPIGLIDVSPMGGGGGWSGKFLEKDTIVKDTLSFINSIRGSTVETADGQYSTSVGVSLIKVRKVK
jgi:hypothetical protein